MPTYERTRYKVIKMVSVTFLGPIYLPLDQLGSQNINPPFQENDIVLKINLTFRNFYFKNKPVVKRVISSSTLLTPILSGSKIFWVADPKSHKT